MSDPVIQPIDETSSSTCFMYLLMNAIDRAIVETTKMQVASATTTSQASDSFSAMVKGDNTDLSNQSKKVSTAATNGKDKELTDEQTKYSQMQQEMSAKETIFNGTLEVSQQTTSQYSQTMQQHVQIGGVVAQLAGSVGHMLERGYS